VLIRIGFIALFLLTAIGPAYIALYIIGAIFTPLEPKEEAPKL
jgi:phage shock protein PspC (stress-responsive transcriptional regulator)